ncbi:hypothetical protein [Thermogemmatispora tikiterensis]|nr:hypothetical protein [Thermogemmatispora tikiterensis]
MAYPRSVRPVVPLAVHKMWADGTRRDRTGPLLVGQVGPAGTTAL